MLFDYQAGARSRYVCTNTIHYYYQCLPVHA